MTDYRASFQAIGTGWEIQVDEGLGSKGWAKLTERVYIRIQAFDKAYSRFRADSLVTAMSRSAGTYRLPPDAFHMLEFYKKLNKLTKGNVTPLIGQVMADAGYDATYSLKPGKLSRPPAWEAVIDFSPTSLTLSQPALLDFGAAGKGYLVDIIAELIEKAGATGYLINAGGDIRYRASDTTQLPVGMENPADTSEAIGIVNLHNQSLCASAGSKRQWGDYHHIISPESLSSPREIIATWVIADDTMTADGLATALFFTDPKLLATQFTFTYALLSADMSLQHHKDFPLTVFEH